MKMGLYTSYLRYPADGSKAREIKVTYNIHENKCNGKKKNFTNSYAISIQLIDSYKESIIDQISISKH
jgi:hypothetical protein